MPELPIGQSSGTTFDGLAVFAAMFFPDDGQKRLCMQTRLKEQVVHRLERLAQEGNVEPIPPHLASAVCGLVLGLLLEPHGGLSVLGDAPGMAELQQAAQDSVWPGSIAGDILLNLVQLAGAGKAPSIHKAIFIELDYIADATTQSGQSVGAGRSYVRDQWSRFKPVCHLWAAFRVLQRQAGGDGRTVTGSDFTPFLPESNPAFLGLAEGLLRIAELIRPRGQKASIFAGSDMWRVPTAYSLPPVQFRVPPLEPWKADLLARYRAPSHL